MAPARVRMTLVALLVPHVAHRHVHVARHERGVEPDWGRMSGHGGGLAKAATKCPPLSPFLGCAQLFYGLSGAAITGGLEGTAVAMALPWPKKSYSPRTLGRGESHVPRPNPGLKV